jgi:ferric-dicitrate binding protein FerR (iron transport regulator)
MLHRRALLQSIAKSAAGLVAIQSEARAQTERRRTFSAGVVAGLTGKASASKRGRLPAATRLLGNGSDIFVGENIQTRASSRLHAQLGAATHLYMGENTRLMIDRHLLRRGGTIHLATGGMMFDRKPPDPGTGVTIRSPFALLAVRGTTFFAGPSNGVFGVFVEDGEVAVSAMGKTVILRPGQGTNIARVGDRPTNAALWGKARIDAARASVR